MRRCASVRPPAVLWCVVYPLLAKLRGTVCRLLIPEDPDVAAHLQEVGLFETLRSAGIEVEHEATPSSSGSNLVVPITRFDDTADVDELCNQVELRTAELGLGAANVRSLVNDVFFELAFNAADHSDSPIGAYALIQFERSEMGGRFLCAVADGGIGIRLSLKRNTSHGSRVPNDWTAIDLACRERITGTNDPHRGIGLSFASDEIRKTGRQMVLHSGSGATTINENAESESRSVALFPGTLAFVSIPA